MIWSELRRKLDLNLILVALLSIFAFAPLTHPGFFQSHSGFAPVFNLFELEANLWRNWGWAPTEMGHFDLLRAEGPLPYLLAEFLRWLGLGGVEAIKAVYLLGFLGSGLSLYLLAKELHGPKTGLVAAVVYIYLPYHLATVYVRGAFAEAWAFVLYPLILLCWDKYVRTGGWLWASATVLFYAMLAVSNLGLALLYTVFLLAYALLLTASTRAKARSSLLLVAAAALSLLLHVPMLLRFGLSLQMGGDFAEHFVYPFQLFSAGWGYGASVPGWEDTLPLQLGLPSTGLTLLAAMLLLRGGELDPTVRRQIGFFVVGAGVMVLLIFGPASLVWRASLFSFLLRYPWQILALVGLAMSISAGAVSKLARPLGHLPWQAVIVTLAILASYGYLSPHFTDVRVGGAPVALFDDKIALLAYQREGPLRHGATVRLHVYWQCLNPMETNYTVFVHVMDSEGTIWGQSDAMPANGDRPTSSWQPGEVIEDEYEVKISVDGPREGYTIKLGVYVLDTGERLRVCGGGTTVTLDR